ncbi:hypothetical protein Tco_1554390 [Tanacetum coccineum]
MAGDGVASIKRRRRDLYSDRVTNFATISGRGRLKEDLEWSTWRRCLDYKAMPLRRHLYNDLDDGELLNELIEARMLECYTEKRLSLQMDVDDEISNLVDLHMGMFGGGRKWQDLLGLLWLKIHCSPVPPVLLKKGTGSQKQGH